MLYNFFFPNQRTHHCSATGISFFHYFASQDRHTNRYTMSQNYWAAHRFLEKQKTKNTCNLIISYYLLFPFGPVYKCQSLPGKALFKTQPPQLTTSCNIHLVPLQIRNKLKFQFHRNFPILFHNIAAFYFLLFLILTLQVILCLFKLFYSFNFKYTSTIA